MLPPLWLSVLGMDYRVSLDHPGLRDMVTALYERFLVEAPPETRVRPHRSLEVRTGTDPAFTLDGERRSLSPEAASEQAFVLLSETFLRESRACRVLHAAALTVGDRAVLVAGPSTYGKSLTLALLLLERGLGFLGDDFAPLDTSRGTILPFPKTIGIRPRVEQLLSPLTRSRLEAISERRLGTKRLVDVEELFPGQLSREARVGLVVLLVPPEGPHDPLRQVLEIGTLGEIPALEEALAPYGDLSGPMHEEGEAVRRYTLVRRARQGPGVPALARALDPFAERILFIEKIAPSPPRFDGEPALEPCPPSEALLALGSDLLDRNGPRGRILDDEENAASLIFELSGLLGRARFLRLRIGRFATMADLVARAAREGP